MEEPKTIKEAVEQLQQAAQIAMPGMVVTVSINITAGTATIYETDAKTEAVIDAVTDAEKEPEPQVDDITLDGLKTLLNSYVKAVGKDKAVELVSGFTKDGSINPAEIKPEDYPSIIKAIAEVGCVLSPRKNA